MGAKTKLDNPSNTSNDIEKYLKYIVTLKMYGIDLMHWNFDKGMVHIDTVVETGNQLLHM